MSAGLSVVSIANYKYEKIKVLGNEIESLTTKKSKIDDNILVISSFLANKIEPTLESLPFNKIFAACKYYSMSPNPEFNYPKPFAKEPKVYISTNNFEIKRENSKTIVRKIETAFKSNPEGIVFDFGKIDTQKRNICLFSIGE